MSDLKSRDLAYHHAECARLTIALAAARPNSRQANILRATLKHHQDILGGGDKHAATPSGHTDE